MRRRRVLEYGDPVKNALYWRETRARSKCAWSPGSRDVRTGMGAAILPIWRPTATSTLTYDECIRVIDTVGIDAAEAVIRYGMASGVGPVRLAERLGLQPERGGPIRPRDIGYRVRIGPGTRWDAITVTARPTLRLRLAMRAGPVLLSWLASAMALVLRLFPAGVRPTVSVTVN
jgi:hypothetical protein